jgi:hypothetical protein
MSSATSTNSSVTAPSTRREADSLEARSADVAPPAFQPWQFFLLAGMLAATVLVIVAMGQSPAAIILLSLTIVAASFVGLGVYRSIAPLVMRDTAHAPQLLGGRTRAALEREKTLVLRSIKELEFDYAMKKVAQADFDEMAGRLRTRALRLMRQLEAGDGYRAEIERELQTRLSSTGPIADPSSTPTKTESLTPGKVRTTTQCSCGTTNDPDARFCKNCGTRLDAPA